VQGKYPQIFKNLALEVTPLYRKKDDQITIDDFLLPFGGYLLADNRWVIKAKMIPWEEIEGDYADLFPSGTGTVAKPARVAFGALIIKETLGLTDEETVEQIRENPYLQYFLGYKEFSTEKPFDPSLMVFFRKRFGFKNLIEINETICKTQKRDDDDPPPTGGGDPDQHSTDEVPQNRGKMLMDATCVPADIRYPTDLGLLNEARQKTEKFIDILYEPLKGEILKPRTYRNIAKSKYLAVAKLRLPRKKQLRKAIRQQLNYIHRNLKHIETLSACYTISPLSIYQGLQLETIKELYRQQLFMYKNKTHSVENRIVSISQPHIKPIVRGKARASVEFGAKLAISVVDGMAYLEKLSWDNFSEAMTLIEAIESYYQRHGFYPESVHVDKIYRTHENISYCKARGIRLSGPRLGRPPKEPDKALKKLARQDERDRIPIEGKFGEGKRRYGLSLIKEKLKQTSEATIIINLIVMNLARGYRDLFVFFSKSILRSIRACFMQLARWSIPAVA
jgi:transposase, IS5 family